MKRAADIPATKFHMISFGLTEDLEKVVLFKFYEDNTASQPYSAETVQNLDYLLPKIFLNPNVPLVINVNSDANMKLILVRIGSFLRMSKAERVVLNLKGLEEREKQRVYNSICDQAASIVSLRVNGWGEESDKYIIDSAEQEILINAQKAEQEKIAQSKYNTPQKNFFPPEKHTNPSSTSPPKNTKPSMRWSTGFRASMFLLALVSGILIPIVSNTSGKHNPFSNIDPEVLLGFSAFLVGLGLIAQYCIESSCKQKDIKELNKDEKALLNTHDNIAGTLLTVGAFALFASAVWALTAGEAISLEGFQMENRSDRLFTSLYGMLGVSSLLLGASEAVAMVTRKNDVRNSFVARIL